MYHYKLLYRVEIFRKKVFGGCKSQIFFIGDRVVEARRHSERHGDSFARLIGKF